MKQRKWLALLAAVATIGPGQVLAQAGADPATPDAPSGLVSPQPVSLRQAAASVQAEGKQSTADAQTGAPPVITLEDALKMARANSVDFQQALTQAGIAHEDKTQARARLLPTLTYNNQFLYTEGNGTAAGRFVASNGVHEYLSQGNAHEAIGVAEIADYRRAAALDAVARAQAEIARRGLVVTVVENYYGLVAAQRKYATAQSAASEAQRFLKISQDLERGGEVAQADVLKAQLQFNDRQRDLREAELSMERAQIALAALLFREYNLNYTVVDEHTTPQPLPGYQEIEARAKQNNPQLAAALKAVQAARDEVDSARGGYLPTLALDYFYGVDANQLAVHGQDSRTGQRFQNLGYSAAATLNIPVWNWGATHSRVKQGLLREGQAKLVLSATQKKLLGDLRSLYDDAATGRAELETLRASTDLAEQSLKLTTLRYQAGEATVLEVVDAQNAFSQARNSYDDGEVRYQAALANLQTLTGSLP